MAGLVLATGMGLHAQSFQTTLYTQGVDHNHYSIETSRSDDYILAGTRFTGGTSGNDIHVVRLDINGAVLWERVLDYSSDDRALDIAEDPDGDIVVCGYVIRNSAETFYVLKLDANGNFITDTYLDYGDPSAATNIIYSDNTQEYYVGGLVANSISYPLTSNAALLVRMDLNLGHVWTRSIYGENYRHASINDIVDLPDGPYVTGSFDFEDSWMGIDQGVLSKFFTHAGVPAADLSFHSTNWEHVGVSAIYEQSTDNIYLMSNNSYIHNPQITIIQNATTATPANAFSYFLQLDPSWGSWNAAGFELRPSVFNTDNIVACGYFRTFNWSLTNINNATCWLAEFDKFTGINVLTQFYTAPSANFHAHGGGVFSTFSGEHPYIFNQEILTHRADMDGYVFVAPRDVMGDYAVDVLSTIFQTGANDCLPDSNYDTVHIYMNDIHPDVDDPTPNDGPVDETVDFHSEVLEYCVDQVAQKRDIGHLRDASGESFSTLMQVFPNPATDNIQVSLDIESVDGDLKVTNALGELIWSTTIAGDYPIRFIDLEDQPSGLYFVTFEGNNQNVVQKVIKH